MHTLNQPRFFEAYLQRVLVDLCVFTYIDHESDAVLSVAKDTASQKHVLDRQEVLSLVVVSDDTGPLLQVWAGRHALHVTLEELHRLFVNSLNETELLSNTHLAIQVCAVHEDTILRS